MILAVPGVRFRSHNLAMSRFVFQAVVIIALREAKTLTGGAEGLNIPAPVVFGHAFRGDAEFLLLCGLLAAVMVLPLAILLAGPFGKNLRAVASNENAARAFGINVSNHLIAAFAWSSAAIAFAGAVSAPRFRIVDPDSFGIMASIFALAYPIIGGMGSIWGGLVGGGILRALPELLRPLADYIELIFCVLVVATLTFFPDGMASAIMDRVRSRRSVPAAAAARDVQTGQLTELLSATARVAQPSHDHVAGAPLLQVEVRLEVLRCTAGSRQCFAHGCRRGLCTASWARTARARRRCSTSSPASLRRIRRRAHSRRAAGPGAARGSHRSWDDKNVSACGRV